MTGYERTKNFLMRKPIDRIPVYEHFWGDTHRAYVGKGHIAEGESFNDHFGYDMTSCWPLNMTADLDFRGETVAEDEDTVTSLDGNGAILRRHKKHDTTPEHVGFTVKDLDGWLELKKKLKVEDRRINFEAYRNAKRHAAQKEIFFFCSGVNVFELMHPVIGHETMLTAMLLEPELVLDMCETFTQLTIDMQKILFEREGAPDGVWYYEDMGFKQRPFMSPAHYREFIKPFHTRSFQYAKSLGLPVVVHSCGYVEPFIGDLIDAGMDCLQVIEVKAGMDPIRIFNDFGDRLSLMGGIDVRVLYSNDKSKIDAELEKKIPILKQNYGYCLHSDHSIPQTVDYETYRYFIDKGIELGTY